MAFKKDNLLSSILIVCVLFFSMSCKQKKEKQTSHKESQELIIPDSLKWSERMALSVIKRYPKAWQIDDRTQTKWDYKIGMFCLSLQKLYDVTGKDIYFNYGKDYADTIINYEGEIKNYKLEDYNIDNINAGKILFDIYETTQNPKFLSALKTLREQLETHLRTPSGGFWHKRIYPNQMWLDGLYMGQPFYARFNTEFENGEKLDDVAHHFKLLHDHTLDEETGLYFHAWDESKQMDWANEKTGTAPNFWLRALGWYAMALVDTLDYFPEDHEKRQLLIDYLNQLAEAIQRYQDQTGLWYQVPNMPDKKPNYLEASGSCMLTYALAKGANKGYLPEKFLDVANKGFDGIVKELIKVDDNGEVHITQVCKSAGLGGNPYRDGSFEYYMSEPILTDNSHGLGPFVLAAIELNR